MDLSQHTTEELVGELLKRRLTTPEGMLPGSIWPLRVALGAIACVDGVAISRDAHGSIKGGVIRRKTGAFSGKLALIGGVVGLYESISHAMARHWRTDLGLSISMPLGWDRPVCMRQYAPHVDGMNRDEFCHDPSKHSYASTHLVTITSDPRSIAFGSTSYGGQEASGFEWYTRTSCPSSDAWAYDMGDTFIACLDAAEKHAHLFT